MAGLRRFSPSAGRCRVWPFWDLFVDADSCDLDPPTGARHSDDLAVGSNPVGYQVETPLEITMSAHPSGTGRFSMRPDRNSTLVTPHSSAVLRARSSHLKSHIDTHDLSGVAHRPVRQALEKPIVITNLLRGSSSRVGLEVPSGVVATWV